jgi:hypothetical protein
VDCMSIALRRILMCPISPTRGSRDHRDRHGSIACRRPCWALVKCARLLPSHTIVHPVHRRHPPPTTHHPQPTGQANGAGSSLGQHNQAAHWPPRCLSPLAGRRGVRCGGQCARAPRCRRPRGLQLRWGWIPGGKRHDDTQLAFDCQSIPNTIHSLPTSTTPRRIGHHAAPRGDCVGRLRPSGAHTTRGRDPKRR